MESYVMKERKINLNGSYDVLVVGGGPAGCTAAAASAREGAKTLLIEATGCLGGMGTSGLVPAWCPFSDKEKIIYKGLAEKVFTEVKKGMAHVKSDAMDWVPLDPELLKRVYDDLVTQAGADVLFNTMLSAVEMDENDKVATVIVSNKQGLTAYKAKVYVDCTGDADLAAWAGAKFQKGDDKNGELQAATHCFILSNVDEYGYNYGPRLHPDNPESPIYDIAKSEKYNLIEDTHLCNNTIGPGTVGFNAGHLWNVDNTNPVSVSKALMKGRKMAAQFRDALAEYCPKAFANAFLVSTASLMGIRETRRIIGDYVITKDDYLARRTFKDEICRNSYYLDIHSHKNVENSNQNKAEDKKQCARYGKGESHGIPYRCLTPKGLKNVLVAGRSISCDRITQGSIRVMPVCLAMGEAAGIAASQASKSEQINVHAIDVQHLRQRIREEGGYIL
ncbi:MAG: FAD-dependent oxidoreductase [Clostridiales bacterium]|nr:FAD-dependent oxidoreductase [Clostridiales bacterium]